MSIRIKSILLLLVFVVNIITFPTFACESESDEASQANSFRIFSDVAADHWAYEAISYMAKKGTISGTGDGTFKPGNTVTRAEFAKMMVLALDLQLIKPDVPSFKDMNKSNWAYKYVESAKYYLTGFRTSSGDYFKPGSPAVREDMAVSLVKAKGYSEESDSSILETFCDNSKISINLKGYVSAAVKNNIMEGYPVSGSNAMEFGPQNNLTRAEAAVLLYRTIIKDEEKVTFEEDKVTFDKEELDENTDNSESAIPKVTASVDGEKIVLNWQPVSSEGFVYYKVVISKYNSNPKYPEDGYLYYITDRNKTTAVINNSEPYKNGDFGKYLIPGEKYYFSVTAVYKDRKVRGNSLQVTFPLQ